MAERPAELQLDAKWDRALDLTLRRSIYGMLAGGVGALLLFSACPPRPPPPPCPAPRGRPAPAGSRSGGGGPGRARALPGPEAVPGSGRRGGRPERGLAGAGAASSQVGGR